jgi:hypothetical protein
MMNIEIVCRIERKVLENTRKTLDMNEIISEPDECTSMQDQSSYVNRNIDKEN